MASKKYILKVNNTEPDEFGNVSVSGGGTGIQSIQEGDNITVDNTDPLNPIVNFDGTIISKFVFNEVPLGTIDGINSIFNASFLLVPDTEVVFINGQKQKKPDDYNISGQTITFTFSPGIGEFLTINYIKQ